MYTFLDVFEYIYFIDETENKTLSLPRVDVYYYDLHLKISYSLSQY